MNGVRCGTVGCLYATSRKVAGSIPNGVIGILRWHNPSGRTVALWLAQLPTKMSTINISCGVKTFGAEGWQPYYLHVPFVLKSGSLNLLEPSGPVQACNGIALPVTSLWMCRGTVTKRKFPALWHGSTCASCPVTSQFTVIRYFALLDSKFTWRM